MSETDSFIQEVTEEVRQDRMFALWKKWAPVIVGVAVVLVGGAALWTWNEARLQAAAEARGAAFIKADPDDVSEQLALPGQVDGAAVPVAELAAASALMRGGQFAEAAGAYARVAERTDLPAEYRDFARLQEIRARAETGDTSGLAAALAPLTTPEAPYRLLAIELRAALHLSAGDRAAAHADLNAILVDPFATPALRQRALAVLTATGGRVGAPQG